MHNKPRLAYWNMRGYAQPIRLLLAYTKTDYKDKRYIYTRAADGVWINERFKLGLKFPNVSSKKLSLATLHNE